MDKVVGILTSVIQPLVAAFSGNLGILLCTLGIIFCLLGVMFFNMSHGLLFRVIIFAALLLGTGAIVGGLASAVGGGGGIQL
jgi:hypothetical protein